MLILKAPSKIAADDILLVFKLFSRENNAWHFKWIVCFADDSLEMSSIIYSENEYIYISKCHLLQLWLALFGVTSSTSWSLCSCHGVNMITISVIQKFEPNGEKMSFPGILGTQQAKSSRATAIALSESMDTVSQPAHDKTYKMAWAPSETQISLSIHLIWSESLLSAWRKIGSLATHWAHSEDSDQTGRMPRLIWVFAGRTIHFVGFVMHRLII